MDRRIGGLCSVFRASRTFSLRRQHEAPAGRGTQIGNSVTCITYSTFKAWHHLFRHMNQASHRNTLCKLRAQLEHFDRSPDFGDAEAVAAIRRHLLLRIREAESSMRCRLPARPEQTSQWEAA